MLDFQALQQQMKAFGAHQKRFLDERETNLHEAIRVYEALVAANGSLEIPNDSELHDKLVADPVDDDPLVVFEAGERPTPMTLVASDGSQIYPDRHIEPLCYLINISRIAFQYGTTEEPEMGAVPRLFFRGQSLDGFEEEWIDVTGQEVVSAFRDELELSELFQSAVEARKEDRPLLAMSDGTLIRWMLRRMQNRTLEDALLKRYTHVLESFHEEEIPLCSYISMPSNKEFVRLLMYQEQEDANTRERSLRDLNDRVFFEEILPPGARSGVFMSRSRVLSSYRKDVRVCFFYVHIPSPGARGEVARVEVPFWVTQEAHWIRWVHAAVMNECRKGRGYPMILSEAHERAVVRAPERALFYEMVDREMASRGLAVSSSQKKLSKERAVL